MSAVRELTSDPALEYNNGPSVSQPNTTRTTPDSGLGDDRNQERSRQIPPGFAPNHIPSHLPPNMRAHQQNMQHYGGPDANTSYEYKNMNHKAGNMGNAGHYEEVNYSPAPNANIQVNTGAGILGGPPIMNRGPVPHIIGGPPSYPMHRFDQHYVNGPPMQPSTGINSSTAVSSGYGSENNNNAPHPGNHQSQQFYPAPVNMPGNNGPYYIPHPQGMIVNPHQMQQYMPHQMEYMMAQQNPQFMHGQEVAPQPQYYQMPAQGPPMGSIVYRQPPRPNDRQFEGQPMEVPMHPQQVMTAVPTMMPPRMMVPQPYYSPDQVPMAMMPPNARVQMAPPQQAFIPYPQGVMPVQTHSVRGRYRNGRGGSSNANNNRNKSFSRQSSISTDHGVPRNDLDITTGSMQALNLDAGEAPAEHNEARKFVLELAEEHKPTPPSPPDEPTLPVDSNVEPEKEPSHSTPAPVVEKPPKEEEPADNTVSSSTQSNSPSRCAYCIGRKKNESEYTGHLFRVDNKVVCPDALVNLECGKCHLKGGPNAHATIFCTMTASEEQPKRSENAPRPNREHNKPAHQGSHENKGHYKQYGRGGNQNRRSFKNNRTAY